MRPFSFPTARQPVVRKTPGLAVTLLRTRIPALALLFALSATAVAADTGHKTDSTKHSTASASQDNEPQSTTLEGVQVTAPIPRKSDSVTKTSTPIIEIPQSVSVVTAEQMQHRAIHGIAQAMWYIAGTQGAAYGYDSRSDWLLVRGFTPARYLDGLALAGGSGSGITRIEPYGLERLEVLKGPSSMVYGAVPPGGLINMVSKRPTEKPLHEIQLQAGSYDLRELAFDFGGPLNQDGSLLYRLTGLARNSNTEVDYIKDDRYYFAPALTWKPNDATSLTVLTRWQKAETASGAGFLPAAGTLLPNPHGKIPSSRFTGEPGKNDYDKTIMSAGYQFRHDFDNGMSFTQNLRYGKVDIEPSAGVGAFGLAADQRTLIRYLFPNENHTRTFGVDNHLLSFFDTGALQHTLLVGLDYRRAHDDYASAFDFNVAPLDIFDPVYGSPVTTPAYTQHTVQIQSQLGVYLQDQIRLDRWLFTLGGREDRVRTDTRKLIAGTRSKQTDHEFSGRVGVNYLFDNGLAPYVSWSHSFQPTVGTDFAGNVFQPTTGDQYEIGLKYQPAGGHGLVTLAAYQITQKNSLTVDPAHTLFQVQQGETRLRGVELEGRWNISTHLSIHGDYTWSDSEVTRTNDLPALGKQIALLPEHQAALGADYTFVSGPLAGFGFGGGVRYVGAHFGDTYNQWQTPAYTLVDAAMHYATGNWRLQLNATNLFDKEYISACNSAVWCYYGYSRHVTVTARYRW